MDNHCRERHFLYTLNQTLQVFFQKFRPSIFLSLASENFLYPEKKSLYPEKKSEL